MPLTLGFPSLFFPARIPGLHPAASAHLRRLHGLCRLRPPPPPPPASPASIPPPPPTSAASPASCRLRPPPRPPPPPPTSAASTASRRLRPPPWAPPPPRPPAASARLPGLHPAASAHLRRLRSPPRPPAASAASARLQDLNNAIPHRSVIQALADKFTASAARAGKVTVYMDQFTSSI
ncbi:hypothetical protein GUJ93_ZPchr0465g6500 [Zizania palustris]|uniref:Uncharacterized protein n=1 Tax=Zizania palustris TaxID=103762 RepID=A0A8J5RK58_ZIZPA|nr:hypothetical protein GUJ93_ZPchr0465g6500 [Zizania palustris]